MPTFDVVGWRERDWARFDDGERNHLFGDAAPLPTAAPGGGGNVRLATFALMLLGAAGAAFFELGGGAPNVQRSSGPLVAAPPADAVSVQWRDTDVAPAPFAGQICVEAGPHGRICAHYVAGERPADTLTRELTRRGLAVRSSG